MEQAVEVTNGAAEARQSDADALRALVHAIPAHCYERSNRRSALAVVRIFAVYALTIAVLALTSNPFLILGAWVLSGYALSGLFVLGHDAAHQSLFDRRVLNDTVGRALFLLHLHVYQGWVFGHNHLHHGHAVRQQLDFVWHPLTVEEYLALPAWKRLRHRIEWSVLGPGLYYVREVWWNKMITFKAPVRFEKAIRRDKRLVAVFLGVVLVGLVGTGTMLYGSLLGGLWLFTKLFVVPWFAFMWFLGFTVYVHHIHERIKWWPRAKWNRYRGQVEGTTILHVSRLVNFFACNIYLHVPHHVDMRIPFYHLPEAARAIQEKLGGAIPERTLRVRDYARTAHRCKLYDFEGQRWLTYRQGWEQAISPAVGQPRGTSP